MSKQTAVDWLIDKVYSHIGHIDGIYFPELDRHFDKAKEMDKQQTIKFAEEYNWYLEKCKRGVRGSVVEMDAEQYYNEIFNK